MARSAAAIVRQVRQRARAELVATVLVNEAATLRAWGPTLRRLNMALLTAQPGEVDALVAQATRELAGVTLQHATRSITQGVGVGVRAGRVQRAALIAPNGPLHTPEAAALPAGISPQQARTITEATVNGAFARDRIPLSSRLYRNAGEVARDASSVVRESISARTGVFQAAETFIERNRDSMLVPIPQYTQDLIDAARGAVDSGDRRHLERLIEKHTAQMEALGEGALRADGLHSLRSTVRQFVRDVRTATPENIERIIAQHITDRAQFQARRIVRSETAEAHRRAFRADSDESPYTVGYRFVLSPSHPRPDVCDCLANQNLHGLGPGGYPKDQVPETPHANCLCTFEAIIDEHYFRRQLAERRGEEAPPTPWVDENRQTANEWLAGQPASLRHQLLGPTRTSIFDAAPDLRHLVIDSRGVPIPVRQVLATTSFDPRVAGLFAGR